MFFATERLDAARAEAFDESLEKGRSDVLLGNEPGKRGQRYRFVVVDANGQPHVNCGVHGTSRVDTRGVPLLKRVSCYWALEDFATRSINHAWRARCRVQHGRLDMYVRRLRAGLHGLEVVPEDLAHIVA